MSVRQPAHVIYCGIRVKVNWQDDNYQNGYPRPFSRYRRARVTIDNFSLRDRERKVVFYFAGVLIVCYTAVFSAVRQPSWRDDTKNGCVGDYGIKDLGKGLWLGQNFVISSGSACRGAWWLPRVCFNKRNLTEAPSLGLAKSVCVLSGAVTCG